MKICRSCGVGKPASGFYSGRAKCKTCYKTQVSVYRTNKAKDPDWAEKERKRLREAWHRLGYKNSQDKIIKYRINNPNKYRAHIAAQSISNPEGTVKHHWCYQPECYKDVIIMEPEDHYIVHRCMIYDEESLKYFDMYGKLLSCRTKHLLHIQNTLKENGRKVRIFQENSIPVVTSI